MKQEIIKASATMLRNVHADCGTDGLLAHCTGRPHASQTPHGHLGLPAPTLQSCPTSSVTGTTWLACHLASLVREKASSWQAGFLGEGKGQPLASLPTPLTAAPQLPPRLWGLPQCLPKDSLPHSPAREAVTWQLTVWRCAAARAGRRYKAHTDG